MKKKISYALSAASFLMAAYFFGRDFNDCILALIGVYAWFYIGVHVE